MTLSPVPCNPRQPYNKCLPKGIHKTDITRQKTLVSTKGISLLHCNHNNGNAAFYNNRQMLCHSFHMYTVGTITFNSEVGNYFG